MVYICTFLVHLLVHTQAHEINTGLFVINPRHTREGYSSRFVSCMCVCVYVCVSVTELVATYLIYTLKVGCH